MKLFKLSLSVRDLHECSLLLVEETMSSRSLRSLRQLVGATKTSKTSLKTLTCQPMDIPMLNSLTNRGLSQLREV
jgi:hypothetical protein